MSAAHLRSSASIPSCSGRSPFRCHNATFIPALRQQLIHRQRARAPVFAVHALYNFAESAEVRVPGQRRNRGLLKKEAREIMDVVRGLTSMSPKQLAAVSHMLPPGAVEAVGVAARLPRSNQGRKRQEGLVAKMLRGQLTEQLMDKLQAAVTVATERQGIYDDTDVSGLVDVWQEGLLGDDEAVVEEVYGYPAAWAPDYQQLRALVRQCQQALEEEQTHEAARLQSTQPFATTVPDANRGSSSSSTESDSDGINDGEGIEDVDDEDGDLVAVLAEAAARSGAGGLGGGGGAGRRRRGRKAKAPQPRSRGLIRSLRKMLRPLAVRVVQEGLPGA
ncbi:hypothetical protein VOLCADRAFT_105461 [Volvox carteri f. nagariensis]|uniref:Uncharacterized protein n=1 Tax=Volvox carteri f. nagariensis TaxID=3068 RepID=D8U0Z5_VOLCA|nr:uncharacterized protein VOLCADRAFT_105461 [Volvox carteri f. nagariensis]EFJ46469.1 hypothetical protein VOLCADRAFT_105461 [Volvox carteri f. nagariensis]|eukprot:XP_002952326.1 hypothetical protein VOLCADRAFT_105461 [Volvox carteri f. nagariensis]